MISGSRGEEEEVEEEGLLYMVELAGFEQVEMCENKREAQTLARCCLYSLYIQQSLQQIHGHSEGLYTRESHDCNQP